ncbi:MAG: glycosyltransferase, partial [Nitrospirae bacterium]
MEAPLVTVVVPTRDRPELLGEALEGIAEQRFSDYEVVVVDDSPGGEAAAVNRQVVRRFGDRFR